MEHHHGIHQDPQTRQDHGGEQAGQVRTGNKALKNQIVCQNMSTCQHATTCQHVMSLVKSYREFRECIYGLLVSN